MDHDSGRSKGYGFVSMGSSSHAAAAVSALDNYQFPGAMKPMSVKVADNNRQAGARPGFPGIAPVSGGAMLFCMEIIQLFHVMERFLGFATAFCRTAHASE